MNPYLPALGIVTIWALVASTLPVTQDEAYYALWAQDLAWGYYDHPPGVGLMSLFGRTGVVLAGSALAFALLRFYRLLGLRGAALVSALTACLFSLIGLLSGVLVTPDTLVSLAWVLAMSEAVYALRGQKWRWLTTGLICGLGLLAKYTMVLLAPALLYAVWRRDPQQLRSRWPWAGLAVAFLVFAPHVIWNAQHDWITMRFQLGHGFGLSRPIPESVLPPPLPYDEEGHGAQFAQALETLLEAEEKEEKQERFYDPLLKILNKWIGFFAAQIGFWGAFAFVFIYLLIVRRRRETYLEHHGRQDDEFRMVPPPEKLQTAAPLLWATTLIPLLGFGVISPFVKAEANWAACYMFSAAPLLATLWVSLGGGQIRRLMTTAAVNLGILGLVVWHVNHPLPVGRAHHDRLLKETHGYAELSQLCQQLAGPVFADSYQLVAMLRYYGLDDVEQWPGISRPSEFTRSLSWQQTTLEDLIDTGQFWIITSEITPPNLRGFRPQSMSQLRDCRGEKLQKIDISQTLDVTLRCKEPVHEWYLIQYVVN